MSHAGADADNGQFRESAKGPFRVRAFRTRTAALFWASVLRDANMTPPSQSPLDVALDRV